MKKILIVEGNLKEENQSFTEGGIKTHTESLKDSISYFRPNFNKRSFSKINRSNRHGCTST